LWDKRASSYFPGTSDDLHKLVMTQLIVNGHCSLDTWYRCLNPDC
jgi:hypothetical protein